jgi:hypothetical protein
VVFAASASIALLSATFVLLSDAGSMLFDLAVVVGAHSFLIIMSSLSPTIGGAEPRVWWRMTLAAFVAFDVVLGLVVALMLLGWGFEDRALNSTTEPSLLMRIGEHLYASTSGASNLLLLASLFIVLGAAVLLIAASGTTYRWVRVPES